MTDVANTTDFPKTSPGIFARFGRWITQLGEASYIARGMEARVERLHKLQLKSDAELAEIGLRRDELPAYVFRDLMYA